MGENEKPIPNAIGFERRYSDGSGIEMAVRLKDGAIEFERVEKVDFPASELNWLIQTLMYIYCQIGGTPNQEQSQ